MDNWVSSGIIYQVNLRSLAAREPRNAFEAACEQPPRDSPLQYVTRNLDYLCELGVNVLYLMPPYPIGIDGRKGIGSPYSIRDFSAVESEYGTMEELLALVHAAHERGLRIIFDITPNHTARDHIWTSEHPDYYVHNPDGSLFYDFDWSDVAKLDYTNPDLRAAMVETYDFWLGSLGNGEGIDGFRLDMAHLINDLDFWNSAIPVLRSRHPDRELLFLAESYGTQNNLGLFSRGINAAYDDDFYKVCVFLYALDAGGNTTVALSPEAVANGDFSDKLEAFRAGGIAGAMERVLLNYEDHFPDGAEGPWLARYTDNHDEGRGLHRFGEGAVRAAMSLAFLSGHSLPFILTGQEFGAVNRPSIHERQGICDKGPWRATESRRERMPGIEFEGNLFARGIDARRRWYTFYRELIDLRTACRPLREGAFRIIDIRERCEAADRTVIAFERQIGNERIRCAVNLGPMQRELGAADLVDGKVLHGRLSNASLAPFSAIVVHL